LLLLTAGDVVHAERPSKDIKKISLLWLIGGTKRLFPCR
jgi:hypothetical protein